MILVVMAAGIGSRFGGLKQLTPVGPNNEFLIDYSIYDAIRSGINKVIFVIKKEHQEEFHRTIGKRISKKIEVKYVYQEINNVPKETKIPQNRTKPWGTGHALLSCKDHIDDNFIIINSDDFYGYDAIKTLINYLKKQDKKATNYAMVAYDLKNTLSTNGSVNRGICILKNDHLKSITERTNIEYINNDLVYKENNVYYPIDKSSKVSVNLFGFTPKIFDDATIYFQEFFKENNDLLKSEFYLPTIVQKSIDNKKANVKVLSTTSKFNGMTYKEDLEQLKDNIQILIKNNEYPQNLWDE